MVAIKDMFPRIFDGSRARAKPISDVYRKFSERYGFQKTIFDLADNKIEKVKEINQEYLTTIMYYLTYLKDKDIADVAQSELDETIRKQRSGR